MKLSLQEASRWMGSRSVTPEIGVSDWSIDTRTLRRGAVYFALRGDRLDGHDFVPEAFAKGAAAAVVEEGVDFALGPEAVLIRVPDTLRALQELARQVRRRLRSTIIGVTGSAGKTSTKDTIATILSAHMGVSKNEGNLNNHIGVPLSLLRFDETSDAGVLEMGMNHAGEIRFLASIASPQIGVVTNVGSAHIENFASIEGIAAAKRELVESLPPDGAAVLNADDHRVAGFRRHFPGQCVTFGIKQEADFRAENIRLHQGGADFTIRDVQFSIPLIGRHAVLNAAAGVAVAAFLGIPVDRMPAAAAKLRAAPMRGELLKIRGVTIVNDTYNSNPEAAKLMIQNLLEIPAQRHVAVLGEMRELGVQSPQLHADLGEFAVRAGIGLLLGIRGAASELVSAAAEAGLGDQAQFFDTPEAAGEALRELAQQGDAILLKGSRGTQVEKALERFMAP